MEFDEDVAPLMQKMDGALARMQTELLPLLAALDEDVLVSHYSVDEQARISLAAAFALVLLTYAHDRLQYNKRAAAVDPQVQLKMDRVVEYIKKLREITQLHTKPQQQQEEQQEEQQQPKETTGGKGGRKRARVEAGDAKKESTSDDAMHAAGGEATADPYGDTILFKEVERGVGKASALLQNLLGHVKAS
ncbi:putative 3 exoribonuclease, partial [Trypanosoma grayi]|uniref:putative 3 exoribonuclease n=1 Tax=Trypanosoma grayi TaxID=71804 RepID=UPI0004F460FE